MVDLSILYSKKINKTEAYYGYTLFPAYTAEETTQKIQEAFDDSVFLGLIKSWQKEPQLDNRIYGVGIKRPSRLANIVATYDFGYVSDIKSLKHHFQTNNYLSKEILLKPYGAYSIEYTGNPSKEELLKNVKKYYDAWRIIQDLVWDNYNLIIGVFNQNNSTWHIAKTDENSKLGFKFIN